MQVLSRRRMVRTDDRLVAGVSGALARSLHVPRLFIRIALVALATADGFGLFFYLLCWVLMPDRAGATDLSRRIGPRDWRDLVAIALVASGVTDLCVLMGFGVPTRILVPVMLAVIGIVVVVSTAGIETEDDRPRPSPINVPSWLPPGAAAAVDVLGTRRGVLVRAIAGGLLVLGGLAVLFGTSESWAAVRGGIIAMIVIGCGIALALGPWLWRLGTELVDERRRRIRSDERAEVAAHLHDSVLQTLAMVQRRAEQPREVVRLARKQERELRTWLLTGERADAGTPAGTIGAALGALAAELEETHGVPVEVVQVRDCDLDDRLGALLLAAREAISNAQRHSGAATVSVYCEVDPSEVTVFVRDRGKGFDRAAVAGDRRGIAESIEGRMSRHGGRATVRSTPSDGTEVELAMPRSSQ